jgi:hypothetical protein
VDSASIFVCVEFGEVHNEAPIHGINGDELSGLTNYAALDADELKEPDAALARRKPSSSGGGIPPFLSEPGGFEGFDSIPDMPNDPPPDLA